MKCGGEREYQVHCQEPFHRANVEPNQTVARSRFTCVQCDVVCTGVVSFELHLASEQHRIFKEKAKDEPKDKPKEEKSCDKSTDDIPGDKYDDTPGDKSDDKSADGQADSNGKWQDDDRSVTRSVKRQRTESDNELLSYLTDDEEEEDEKEDRAEEALRIESVLDSRVSSIRHYKSSRAKLDDAPTSDGYEAIKDLLKGRRPSLETDEQETDSDIEFLEEKPALNRLVLPNSLKTKKPAEKETSPPPDAPDSSASVVQAKQGFFCTACNLHCANLTAILAHLNGKKHIANLMQSKPGPKRTPESLVQITGSSSRSASEPPPVGMNYIRKQVTCDITYYNCVLCRCRMIGYAAIQSHVRGKRHHRSFELAMEKSNGWKGCNYLNHSNLTIAKDAEPPF